MYYLGCKLLPGGFLGGLYLQVCGRVISLFISLKIVVGAAAGRMSSIFLLRPFVKAIWFVDPWFIRSDVLVQVHTTMHSILIAFLAWDILMVLFQTFSIFCGVAPVCACPFRRKLGPKIGVGMD